MLTAEQIREILARLAEMTDEEIAEFLAKLEEAATELDSDEQPATDEVLELMAAVGDGLDAVHTETEAREAAEQERQAQRDALRQRLRGEDPDEGETVTEPVAEAEPEAEPVAAAATAPVVPARRSPGRTRRPDTASPETVTAAMPALVASANLPNVPAGADLSDPARMAAALQEAQQAGVSYVGGRMKFPVMSLQFSIPEERMLDENAGENYRKMNAVTNPAAITAAGGICAPVPIQYDMPTIGSTDRPLRDALPNFGAARGGVRTLTPPTIADVTGAVGTWTEANDITPSSPTTKPCLTVTCGTDATVTVDAITECIRAGNFMDRYFPERIQEFMNLVAVYAARVAEQKLITKIDAGSTAFTVGTNFGTTRDVLAALDRHIAAIRYWYRLGDADRFRFLLPRWLRDNMRTDLAREMPGATAERLAMADGEIATFFAVRGVNISWLMEGTSTQRFTVPAAGHVQAWPSHAIGYLFPEGTWTYINGGRLDLGVVRDSTLNGLNDFQMFAETFENVHMHGTWSHKLDIDICPSGITQAAAVVSVCTSGS